MISIKFFGDICVPSIGSSYSKFSITLKDIPDSFVIRSTNGCNERYCLGAGETFGDQTRVIQVFSSI